MKSNSYKMQNKRFVEVNQVDLVLQNKKNQIVNSYLFSYENRSITNLQSHVR